MDGEDPLTSRRAGRRMLLAGAAAWVAATAARAQGVRTAGGPPARVALFFWGAGGVHNVNGAYSVNVRWQVRNPCP